MAYNPTSDIYAQRSTPVASPARNAMAITKSDTVDLSPYAKGIYVGGTGDVIVIMVNDYEQNGDSATPIKFASVPAGTVLPIQVARVMSTNTSATNMVALVD